VQEYRIVQYKKAVGLIASACRGLSGCTPFETGSPIRKVGKPSV